MRKLIDLTGQKFGRWTVIKKVTSVKGHTKWLCLCECGEKKTVDRGNLLNGSSKSCGCLKNEQQKIKSGLASMRRVILGYKKNANARGLKYNLTEKEFKEITQQNCHYCGAKPGNIAKNRYGNGDYIYNGLDRIDNNKDYTLENCVSCCKICNIAKNNLTLQEYKDWIKKSYNYQNQVKIINERSI